jgi:hypothetical protein
MTDREQLTKILADSLGWDWQPSEGVPSVAECLTETLDAILTSDWLARVKREAAADALDLAADHASAGRNGDTLADWLRARADQYREEVK